MKIEVIHVKKEKIWSVLSVLVWLALAAAEALLGYRILQLDMLPAKYLALVFALLALTAVLIGLLMYQRRGKYQKKKRHIRQIIAYILSALIIAACLIGSGAIAKVNTTISNVTKTPTISAIVDVYVLTDDPAQSLADAKGYTFGVTDAYDWDNTQKTIAKLEDQFGQQIQTVTYPSVFAMIDSLYAGETDALILNSAYLGILEEMEGYTDFADRTRLLHEQAIEEEVPEETAPLKSIFSPKNDPAEQETGPEEADDSTSFIVYLSGSDTRRKVLATSRSDVNILAVVNTETKQVLLVNTPRDYYVSNPAGSGEMDKLTHCGLYGPECSAEALATLYDTSIKYYAQINFTGFQTLIDAIGGVTVYSEIGFTTTHGKHFIQKGENHLNGSQALGFARERYAFKAGDNSRGQNQMKIMKAVIEKLSSGTTIISNYAEILDSLDGLFTTNMTQDEISQLVKMQLSDMATWNVQSVAATGTGGTDKTYATGGKYAYVMYPNEDVIAQISDLIDRVLDGETLTAEDVVLN